jgi:hypothetical protein
MIYLAVTDQLSERPVLEGNFPNLINNRFYFYILCLQTAKHG